MICYSKYIAALTDGTGAVVQRQAFEAWGRRRNVVNWETDDSQVPGVGYEWLRGFTGHEHLDDFGIINMNARPTTARWLPYSQISGSSKTSE